MINSKINVSQHNAERIYRLLGIKLDGYNYLDQPIQKTFDFPEAKSDLSIKPKSTEICQ